MLKTCPGDDSTHAVSDEINDNSFFIHVASDMPFDLVSEPFAHFFDIGFCVGFVGSGNEIIGVGQLSFDALMDNGHVV